MSAAEILDQIRRLEREVLELRRRVAPAREAPPLHPFAALQISVEDAQFLLPVTHVREVVRMPWLAPIPGAPPWLLGNLRYGERSLPVVDLGRRLLSRAAPVRADDALVVVDRPSWCAIAVTEVGDVAWIHPARLPALPPGTPLSPAIIASFPTAEGGLAHLLSTTRLAEEGVIDEP